VTVLSEEDRVGFGFITCPDLVPRVWDLAEAVPAALGELVEVATRLGHAPKRAVPVRS